MLNTNCCLERAFKGTQTAPQTKIDAHVPQEQSSMLRL